MPLAATDFRDLPPAYIAAAGIDAVTEDAEDYAAALQAAGVPVRFSCAESLPHSYLRTIISAARGSRVRRSLRSASDRARHEFTAWHQPPHGG